MKKLSLIIVLIALSFNAYASDNHQKPASSTANAGAIALSQSAAYGSAAAGDSSAYVGGYDAEKNPVASAIAPSVTQNIICPMVSPNSHAVQFLVFGGSTTGVQSVNGICVAHHLGQTAVVEKIACAESAAYRKANKNCQ